MSTAKQKLGVYGENLVIKNLICQKCKKNKTLKKLPTNFSGINHQTNFTKSNFKTTVF